MRPRLLCALLVLLCTALLAGGGPLPSGAQTEFQAARFDAVARQAAAAQSGATAQLLAVLDSEPFRRALRRCCGPIAHAESGWLLDRLMAEYAVAEVATGFSSSSRGHWGMTAASALAHNSSWFANQWESMIQANQSFGDGSGWFSIQDSVETKLYGLKRFARLGAPESMGEARERGLYTLVNVARSGAGSPLYGDVTAILAPRFVRASLLISSIDTGEWTALCNQTFRSVGQPTDWPPYHPNCSAYHFALGSWSNMRHLVLPNLHYWRRPAPACPEPTLTASAGGTGACRSVCQPGIGPSYSSPAGGAVSVL